MALKIQYNKTARQKIEKQLEIREHALPTLQSKETALRMEVQKARDQAQQLEKAFAEQLKAQETLLSLWSEFDPDLIRLKDVNIRHRKIAGVAVPELDSLSLELQEFSVLARPKWFARGVHVMREFLSLLIKKDLLEKKMEILEYARKKTTQKVNLYEKVQIPQFREAIAKIKRAMEDEENLSKASQKIVKKRIAQAKTEKI